MRYVIAIIISQEYEMWNDDGEIYHGTITDVKSMFINGEEIIVTGKSDPDSTIINLQGGETHGLGDIDEIAWSWRSFMVAGYKNGKEVWCVDCKPLYKSCDYPDSLYMGGKLFVTGLIFDLP